MSSPAASTKTPRTEKGVTLQQVAGKASVSIAVASTVLSGRTNGIRVGPDARSRVERAARELCYQPRRTARSKTGGAEPQPPETPRRDPHLPVTLGIIDLRAGHAGPRTDSFAPLPWDHEIATTLEMELSGSAETTTRYFTRRPHAGHPSIHIAEAVDALLRQGVTALAVIELSEYNHAITRHLSTLEGCGVPYVLVSSGALSSPVPNVYYDSHSAGFMAAQHLIGRGHTDLLFLAPHSAPWAEERIAGVREALAQAGLPPQSLRVYPDERPLIPTFDERTSLPDFEADGFEAGRSAFEQGAVPDGIGIVAANDLTAFGVMRAAEGFGRIPGVDFAILGFDDMPEARFRGLTTLRAPGAEMGREAARLLLRTLNGEDARQQVRLFSRLLVRASTDLRP